MYDQSPKNIIAIVVCPLGKDEVFLHEKITRPWTKVYVYKTQLLQQWLQE